MKAAYLEISDFQSVIEPFNQCYPLLRKDINALTEISELKQSWPFLFTEQGIFTHFKTLVGIDIKDQVTTSLQDKAGKILSFMKSSESNQIRQQYAEIMHVKELTGSSSCILQGLVLLMIEYMKEDIETVFQLEKETAVPSEIAVKNSTPCIVACGRSVLEARKFYVAVDGVLLFGEPVKSFLDTICIFFASYYLFNIEYPGPATGTLCFIQRCVVGINQNGTKSGKKRYDLNPKVLKFVTALATHEWTDQSTSKLHEF